MAWRGKWILTIEGFISCTLLGWSLPWQLDTKITCDRQQLLMSLFKPTLSGYSQYQSPTVQTGDPDDYDPPPEDDVNMPPWGANDSGEHTCIHLKHCSLYNLWVFPTWYILIPEKSWGICVLHSLQPISGELYDFLLRAPNHAEQLTTGEATTGGLTSLDSSMGYAYIRSLD